MQPVRAKGEGTITWRADRRRWQVAVTFPTGRRYRYLPGPPPPARPPREARDLLAQMVELREAELEPPARALTVAAWLRRWIGELEQGRRRRVRPATLRYYRMIAERHVIPALGSVPLGALSVRRVQAWVDGMEGSPRSVQHRRDVLRRALNVARRQSLIRDNPATLVELPEIPAADPPTLTLEEAATLLRETAGDRLGPLWAVVLGTGLRISEALGLTWDDVDFAAGSLRVERQLAREGGGWVRVPTKASRSLERIRLPGFALEALRAHQRRMTLERTPSWTHFGHVFVNRRGRPYYGWHVLAELYRAEERLGLPRVGLHELRHTNATLMRELGVAEDVRMARLGHSTERMARHYAHVLDGLDQAAADELDRAIGGGA